MPKGGFKEEIKRKKIKLKEPKSTRQCLGEMSKGRNSTNKIQEAEK